jgi:hypothetical protein
VASVGLLATRGRRFFKTAPIRLSPNEAIALLPYTTGVAALLSSLLVAIKLWRQPGYPYFTIVIALATVTWIGAFVLALWFGRRSLALPRWMDANGVTSWIVGVQIGVLLLVVPVLVLTKSVAADDIPGWSLEFVNKRWLITLYNLGIATFLVFPVAVDRWLGGTTEAAVDRDAVPHRARLRTVGEIAIVLALAWYVAGPPWHLERRHRGIDWHEQAHLGSLQAISKGYLPYVGPASTQYGPGSQILLYEAMESTGRFDIVSFREGWATLHFLAVAIFSIAAYSWLGLSRALAVILVALIYSPLAFFYTLVNGSLEGFFGWANVLRYVAPVIVVPALALALDVRSNERALRRRSIFIGAGWGLGAWLAQENLSTTLAASAMMVTLLILTGTTTVSRAGRTLTYLAIGFGCIAVPVLAYYFTRGAAGEFVGNYVMVPRAVVSGYSNMWWPPQDSGLPDRFAYYLTFPFLVSLAVCTLWDLPDLRLHSPLDKPRARMLAFICVQLACYQTALFRSDSTHLMHTMIALPFILVQGVLELPALLASTRAARAVIRAAFIVTALLLYPLLNFQVWRNAVVGPISKFSVNVAPASAAAADNRIADRRATVGLANEPVFADDRALSMRSFLDFANDVHDIVGGRKTYVMDLGGRAWTGTLYFMADLTPAPYPLDRETMTINATLRMRVADHIRSHPGDYECFIGTSLDAPEARAFLDGHPGATTLKRPLGTSTVYILLSHA